MNDMTPTRETRHIKRDLDREIEAATDLLASLGDVCATMAHDMVEGSTDLMEAIDRALIAMDDAEAIAAGCDDRIAVFTERKRAATAQVARIRGLVEQALVRVDLNSARRPTATLTIKKRDPAPIITDEAAIPSQFWKQPAPVLDKKALNEAVKSGADVAGVSLDNGGFTLQIRRK